jgi:hypothetical protein
VFESTCTRPLAGSRSAFPILNGGFGATEMSLEGRLQPVRGPATRMGTVGHEWPLAFESRRPVSGHSALRLLGVRLLCACVIALEDKRNGRSHEN